MTLTTLVPACARRKVLARTGARSSDHALMLEVLLCPLGLDTATAVEGYMPVARPGTPSVHQVHLVLVRKGLVYS